MDDELKMMLAIVALAYKEGYAEGVSCGRAHLSRADTRLELDADWGTSAALKLCRSLDKQED